MRPVRREIVEAWQLLSLRSRRNLVFYGVSLILLTGLDAAALLLVAGLFTGDAGEVNTEISDLAIVVGLFVTRTLLSTTSSWWAVRSMTKEEIRVGSENFSSIMRGGLSLDSTEADVFNAVDWGPTSLTQGVAMYSVTIMAETAAAMVILGTLLVLDFPTAIASSIYFLSVAYVQHRLLSRSSARAGEVVVKETTAVHEMLGDGFRLKKLLSVMPSQTLEHALNQRRARLAKSRGKVSFLGTLPRYTMEMVLSLGLIVVSGVAYVASGEDGVTRAVAIFAVAGFRLLPSINRIQGLVLMMFSTLPVAQLAHLEYFDEIPAIENHPAPNLPNNKIIEFKDVTYTYPSTRTSAINEASVSLEMGRQYAVVGPSGAGKTTFLDLLLQYLEPTSGTITRSPQLIIGYVPQDTHLARIGLVENVALEWDTSPIDTRRADEAIRSVSLDSLGERYKDSAAVRLSEASMSGGQRQRIGLARALYRKPNLLVLDEVTSALDAETEHSIMNLIAGLKGSTTVVIVAHRLTTVQHVDQVIYMDEGTILGVGTFDELRHSIPQLQRQIELGTLNLTG